jgi:hypothetical protein
MSSPVTNVPLLQGNKNSNNLSRVHIGKEEISTKQDDNTLETKLEEFKSSRQKRRDKTFYAIVAPGAILLGLGCITFLLVLYFYAQNEIVELEFTIFANVSMLFLVFGLLMMSLVPSQDLEIDAFLNDNAIASAVLNSLGIITAIPITLYPPYLGIVPLLVGVLMALNACGLSKYFPKLIVPFSFTAPLFILLWFLGLWPYAFFVTAVLYECKDDPNSYVLTGGDTIATECNLWSMWLVGGITFLIGQVVISWMWYQKHGQLFRNYSGTLTGLFDALYLFCILFGFGSIATGVIKAALGFPLSGNPLLLTGFVFLVPASFVMYIGRKQLYMYVVMKLDKDQGAQDGAFLSELLDANPIFIDQDWYVHRESGDKDEAYKSDHHLYNFRIGKVIKINEKEKKFYVNYIDSAGQENIEPYDIPRHTKSSDLLDNGRKKLRLIEWKNLKLELLKKSIRDSSNKGSTYEEKKLIDEYYTELFKVSREVRVNAGERIDFFISHSWSDDADAKYKALKSVAQEFNQIHGRDPTFWFDKVCINQKEIGDGLRLLPVNIQMCDKLLAIFGETYIKRLWCIWEILTLAAFSEEEKIMERLVLSSLPDKTDKTDETNLTLDTNDKSRERMIEELENFNLSNSTCYDPNEEYKLRRIINAVGEKKFHDVIHSIANSIKKDKSTPNESTQV